MARKDNNGTVTKGDMRRMMKEMKAPEHSVNANKERCAMCANLVKCGLLQREILENRNRGKAEPRQLPLYACTTSNFKKFVYNDNNL